MFPFLAVGIFMVTAYATSSNVEYKTIPTAELEKKVEELSIKGELPFEMGLELIKRWQNEDERSK
ncbi:MAG: Unknown protein [uncultured Sulfurovum sp.]|uniref:Uncharacterized protein n=1 Tax=uncultured Sulfurovum sp. TaxID=269237 RepID=A0A6S6SNJ3_9BACT|nr:MAG: Unknown protein [uncultured Sulfurovum sp.]